jgi:hypothetical protein
MEVETIGTELIKFNVTNAEIAKLHADTKDLVIVDENDKPGYEAVHKARMVVKALRVDVTKTGKAYREKANAFNQAVLAEEKRVIGLIQPIEDHLVDEETRYNEALAKIKADVDAKEAARVKARVDRLYQLDCRFDGKNWLYGGEVIASQDVIVRSTDEQFADLIKMLEEAAAEIATARAKEAADKAAKEAELAQIAAEQKKKAQEQADLQTKLDFERTQIEAEKQRLIDAETLRVKKEEDALRKIAEDKLRAEELERAKVEAREAALHEVNMKAKREAEAIAKKEAATKLAAEKKEARRPDKEKIYNYIGSINGITIPVMKSVEGIEVIRKINIALSEVLETAERWVEEL